LGHTRDARRSGISRILMYGHGTGAVVAALFVSDHPGIIDSLLLTSPLHTIPKEIPGFNRPLRPFTEPHDQTSPVCLAYHESLQKGPRKWTWNEDLKPITGWALYVGWLTAFENAVGRLEFGLSIDCPTLILIANKHLCAFDVFTEELLKADVFLDPVRTTQITSNWGTQIQVHSISDAIHDILLSEQLVEDIAFDTIFHKFNWLLGPEGEQDEPDQNATGYLMPV